MALNDAWVTLAGDSQTWDDEMRRRCRPGIYAGTFNSEDLCRVQVDQHRAGRRVVTVWENIYGWAMGYASNLEGRAVLRGGRNEPRLSKVDVIRLGIEWVNQDPSHRSLEVTRDQLIGTEWEVK